MSKPMFSLTKKVPLTMYRGSTGHHEDGDWVEGTVSQVVIQANIQPLREFEILQLPESERTRDWQKLYSADPIYSEVEGVGGHPADEFNWESMEDGKIYRYRVMKVRRYSMGILDHWRGFAARMEITPDQEDL